MTDGRAKNGGTRPGSGRKPKAEVLRTYITAADRYVAERLLSLLDNLVELANGVTVQETDVRTGKTVVYRRPPDRQANEYLVNRVLGKPTERQEQEHSGGLSIHITYDDDIDDDSDETED